MITFSLDRLDDTFLDRIVSLYGLEKSSLLSLCLVNKSMNILASRALYRIVSVSSRSDVEVLCNNFIKEPKNEGHPICALTSSCLPKNAVHVRRFEVTGMILQDPSQTSLPLALAEVLSKYPNLRSLTWRPRFCDANITLSVTHLLPRFPGLEMLSIKVPFILPRLPSPPPALPSLNVIAEEDEEEDESTVSSWTLKGLSLRSESPKDEVDSPPYEYKPLEDDPDEIPRTETSPCVIPHPKLTHLRHLILASPTPEILISLPETLQSLENPLLTLCFEDDCGSVTPGILTSLIPAAQALENFELGVAYSVKYDNLFPFLDSLPKLKNLELYHYPQLFPYTAPLPRLCTLQSLRIIHAHTRLRQHITNMCVWIRRLISAAPLASLEIGCEDAEDCPSRGPGHGISYDGLVHHLISRHKGTLKILKIPGAYLGAQAVRYLLGAEGEGCKLLEELDTCVMWEVFESLADLLEVAPSLRSIRLTVVNARKRSLLIVDDSIFRGGKMYLRAVVVDGHGLRGEWVAELDSIDGQELKAVFRISEIVEQAK